MLLLTVALSEGQVVVVGSGTVRGDGKGGGGVVLYGCFWYIAPCEAMGMRREGGRRGVTPPPASSPQHLNLATSSSLLLMNQLARWYMDK